MVNTNDELRRKIKDLEAERDRYKALADAYQRTYPAMTLEEFDAEFGTPEIPRISLQSKKPKGWRNMSEGERREIEEEYSEPPFRGLARLVAERNEAVRALLAVQEILDAYEGPVDVPPKPGICPACRQEVIDPESPYGTCTDCWAEHDAEVR